ncbi:pyruvate kinase alpha/beta domain-containing protein [Desulfitobacterium sp.]|uniref:pyruvate kinase alpha/beta domain-containing protein n=1 Tax=Desulfitobacterium sp. TaxID=49981 RepID=UPI002B1FC801|nr:pyruvate kinase alpha/beta domain-containing protein [Desulfitobacterium sp.]MEA4900082.1 pyruvate kinase alpha/beta domain-containing protein [Desulfitobacterium sp.]
MEVRYFEKSGSVNNQEVVRLTLKRAQELHISTVVVASNSGATAELFLDQGVQVVCVTHHVGFAGPGVDEMGKERRKSLEDRGVKVLTTTHLFAGIDRALRLQSGGVYPAEIVAHTLRLFGPGVKVGVECSVMALDAGLIEFGEKVIAIGGTGHGADSAIVLTPHHSNDFFKTKIHEIICKPF